MPKKKNPKDYLRAVDNDDKEREHAREGHNSKDPLADAEGVRQLKSYIQRIEKLEEEKTGIVSYIKDVFAEAKGNGFDTKTIRRIIALRKLDPQEREEAELVLHTYMRALGMQMTLNLDAQDKEGDNDKEK